MKTTDFVRLKKLMMLAANNPSDAEAIRAFRAATEIVRAHGFTWEQVMDRRVTVLSAVEAADEADIAIASAPKAPRTPLCDQQTYAKSATGMSRQSELDACDFELAISAASSTFLETLQSIYEQWENGGTLSPRQEQVVFEAAERAARRHRGGRLK